MEFGVNEPGKEGSSINPVNLDLSPVKVKKNSGKKNREENIVDPYQLALEVQMKLAKNMKLNFDMGDENATNENSNAMDDYILQSSGSISPTSSTFNFGDGIVFGSQPIVSLEA